MRLRLPLDHDLLSGWVSTDGNRQYSVFVRFEFGVCAARDCICRVGFAHHTQNHSLIDVGKRAIDKAHTVRRNIEIGGKEIDIPADMQEEERYSSGNGLPLVSEAKATARIPKR